MAEFYIKRLKEKISENVIYPQTVGRAVYLENGNTVEQEISEVRSDIPTKTSELINDSHFINDVSDKADKVNVGDVRDLNTLSNNTLVDAINELNENKINAPSDGVDGQILVKKDDGFVLANRDFVLLDSFTLTQSTYNVTRSIDRNGNEYNLRDIAVIINNPNGINGGANSYAYIYDNDNVNITDIPLYFFASSAAIGAYIRFSCNGDCVLMDSSGWTTASYSPTSKSYMANANGSKNIAKISISSNGYSFNPGTKFSVYGVIA